MKAKLAKENDALRINEITLNDKWRQTMRKMKTESLRNQAQVSAQTFARVSSKKDEIVTALMKELEEAEEQQDLVDRAHLTHVANLLGELIAVASFFFKLLVDLIFFDLFFY
jgi:predicted GTPase